MKDLRTCLILIGVVFGVSAMFLGCANIGEEKPGDPQALQETARTFHTNMRWSRWEHASGQVHEAYRQEFLGRYEELGEDFRIVDLEFRSAELVEEGFAAILEVEQEWYLLPDTTVRKERYLERWVYEGGLWLLGERMTQEDYRANDKMFTSEPAARGAAQELPMKEDVENDGDEEPE